MQLFWLSSILILWVFKILMINSYKEPIEEIQKKIAAISVRGGEFAMTLTEKLIEKGKLEGKLEGKIETAKKMKNKGTDFPFISEVTGLSFEEIEQL